MYSFSIYPSSLGGKWVIDLTGRRAFPSDHREGFRHYESARMHATDELIPRLISDAAKYAHNEPYLLTVLGTEQRATDDPLAVHYFVASANVKHPYKHPADEQAVKLARMLVTEEAGFEPEYTVYGELVRLQAIGPAVFVEQIGYQHT